MAGTDLDLMRASWADFTQLDTRHPAVTALSRASQIRRLKRGAALLIEGQLDKSVYLLVSGSLRTLRYQANGQEIWLTDASPGELVGEIAALTDGARTSSVFTRSSVCLLAVEQAAFIAVAAEHGSVSLAVARLLARRLAHTSRQVADLATLPVANRLHRELLRLGQPSKADDELVRLDTPPSVSTLAQRIHASREATSRALRELESSGGIVRSDDVWIVPMPMESIGAADAQSNGNRTHSAGRPSKSKRESKRGQGPEGK